MDFKEVLLVVVCVLTIGFVISFGFNQCSTYYSKESNNRAEVCKKALETNNPLLCKTNQ